MTSSFLGEWFEDDSVRVIIDRRSRGRWHPGRPASPHDIERGQLVRHLLMQFGIELPTVRRRSRLRS
jgi:hypothetical protein